MGTHDNLIKCIAIEQTAASIYSIFMELFPEEREFWKSLYEDEMEHASFLMSADRADFFSRFPKKADLSSLPFIEKTLEFARNVKKQIESTPITLKDALTLALQLERTIVEIFTNKLIADLQEGNREELTMDFREVVTDSIDHVNKIKDVMAGKGFSCI